jgi:signal transduction histidine kinase/CHASE2 domain-containing sensor protein
MTDKTNEIPGRSLSQRATLLILLLSLTFFSEYFGFFNGTNNYFYDLFFRFRGPREPSKQIVIISIDQKTLGQFGRWPFPRRVYASLLNRLKEAKIVALDIVMAEPSEDDALLGQAIKDHGRVVLPLLVEDRLLLTGPAPSLSPVRTGHVHLEPGIDGVVREVYHTLIHQGKPISSFSSIIFETASGKKLRRKILENSSGPPDKLIQLNRMNINFSGGPGSFERLSLSDVLTGQYRSSFFKGKICLVGATASGVGDAFQTPFSEDRNGMPGVEVHANILNTLLLDQAVTITPAWCRWLSGFFLMLISFLAFLRIKELQAAALAFLLGLSVFAGTYLLFSKVHIWLAPSIFYFFIFTLFLLSYALKLKEAVIAFDQSYQLVGPHLRLPGSPNATKTFASGIKGLLTPRGLQAKSRILQDVTKQLIFEKELSDSVIFSNIQNVILFGPNKAPVLANEGIQKLSEDNSLDFSSLDSFRLGLSPFMVDKVERELFPEKLIPDDQLISFTLSLPLPEKKYFKVLSSSLRVEGERYPLFIFSDVTKIKELELLKGHVVSLVSHEIKTPLTAIEGFGELLEEKLEGEMKEFASIIQKEAERLIRFLNTYLAISRLEGGGQVLKMEPHDLTRLLREVAKGLESMAAAKGLALETVDPGESIKVRIDRDLTKQCLINLIENAIKYSPSGKTIHLKLTQTPDYIEAQVIDQGIGIPEKDLEKIFEKFYRASADGGKPVAGSGLGLTFVKEAIEAQGGSVTVKSRYGGGATFSLRFPQRTANGKSDN